MARGPSPKQARAVATRQALIAATIALLAEQGRTGTTTAAIARRAGVSQGALFRHFPQKSLLLAAATEEILAGLLTEFVDALSHALEAGDLLGGGLRALWQVYRDDRLAGVFELFLAARTDPDLAAELKPIVQAHAERELDIARAIFPAAAHQPDFEAIVLGVMSTIQGAAVAAAVVPVDAAGTASAPLELSFIEALVHAHLGTPEWHAP